MHEEYEDVKTSRAVKIVRSVVVWAAFVVLVWVIAGYWTSFQRTKGSLDAQAQGSLTASQTVDASVVTTVTDLSATIRIDVPLRSQAATAAAVVATAHEGSTLDIVAKKGTWLRLKDKSGHLGWVPNDSQYVTVKTKVATKAKKKK